MKGLTGDPYSHTACYGEAMKTTVELSDAVLEEAKRLAHAEGTSLRAVIERALRRELERHTGAVTPFRLRDASVGGRGLQAEFVTGDWSAIRGAIYDQSGT